MVSKNWLQSGPVLFSVVGRSSSRNGGAHCKTNGQELRRGAAMHFKGGIVDLYHSQKHQRWREKVLRRAGYLCEECARYGRRTPATIAHHVKHADEFPELRFDVTNGRALCPACHNRYHPEKMRKANPPTPDDD